MAVGDIIEGITGLGTESEPYIVNTWGGVIQVLSVQDAYVEFDDTIPESNRFIDVESEVGGWLSPVVGILAKQVKGNGWSIVNVCIKDNTGFDLSNSTDFYNLNFLNCYITNSKYLFYNSYNYKDPHFYNCSFSAFLHSGTFSWAGWYSSKKNSSATTYFDNCSFYLKLLGSSGIQDTMNGATAMYCTCCNFYIVSNMSSIEIECGDYCWIRGNITRSGNTTFIVKKGKQNVIDIDITSTSGGTCTITNNGTVTICNTDKIRGFDTISLSNSNYGVTSETINDFDFLNSIGFDLADIQ